MQRSWQNNIRVKPIFGLMAMLLTLTTSLGSQASSLTYYKQMTLTNGEEAESQHYKIKEMSKKLSFLNCPIEMIERQWGGVQSVSLGMYYMEQFLNESRQLVPNYYPIGEACLHDLYIYRKNNAKGIIRSRAIVGNEYEQFLASATAQNQILTGLVSQVLNKETICYSQRASLSLGYFLTANFGMHHFECYTPLGRRFIMRGPSIGYGIGAIAAATLPNIDQINSPSFTMLLHEQQEHKIYRNKKYVTKAALGIGAAIEQDFARMHREKTDGQYFLFDIRPSVGAGISNEVSHSFSWKKNKAPFYLALSQLLSGLSLAENGLQAPLSTQK